ncbi:MAG: hypothetical protein HWE13_16055 [Gammaproteobacteria bacterium]|nr:hypothetical protein [Gammaproteobacteria bacterium]NVK89653.1 hypothetical protein [Gammaproteobacteria bacterium]
MLTYKGFVAQLDYQPETDRLIGEVVNAPDVILFDGVNLVELKLRFSEAIDDYLLMTAANPHPPIAPFIGRYTVCLDPEDQQKIMNAAERESVGVTHWLNREVQSLIKNMPN